MKIVDLLIVLSADADIRIADEHENQIVYNGNKENIPYSLILKEIRDFDIWVNTDDGLYSPIVVLRI